ncbi:MAG TPA: hypothetical protein VKR58_09345 [Aquella sp.]|nr:hypothetical protein [Aquella sp.]
MQHSFNVNIAKQFDIDTAVFLDNVRFWTLKNLANKKHIHDGLCWTYNTLDAFCDLFPYWSRRQIERVINNCISNKLLQKGNYNDNSYDRTSWYALTEKAYQFYPELTDEKYLKLLNLTISPNGEMDITDRGNGYHQTVKCIRTDNKPDNKPDIKPKEIARDKSENLSLEEIYRDNPHNIPCDLLAEWKRSRKKPITFRVLTAFNRELQSIADAGIKPIDAVIKMLERQWSTVEFKFFRNDLPHKTSASVIPLPRRMTVADVLGA